MVSQSQFFNVMVTQVSSILNNKLHLSRPTFHVPLRSVLRILAKGKAPLKGFIRHSMAKSEPSGLDLQIILEFIQIK